MADDLKLKIEVLYQKALKGINLVKKGFDVTNQSGKTLKDTVNQINKSMKGLAVVEKQLTQNNKALEKAIASGKLKIGQKTEALKKLQQQETRNIASEKLLKNQIRDATRTVAQQSRTLKENSAMMGIASKKAKMLSSSEGMLSSQIIKSTTAEKANTSAIRENIRAQNAAIRTSARRRASVMSAGASLSRAGLTKGGMISAGAALGSNFGMLGPGLIGTGLLFGGAMAAGKSARTGMDLEKTIADIVTRPGERIDSNELRAAIKQVNRESIFDINKVSEAFQTARRSISTGGLSEITGISRTALELAQAEDLTPEKATEMLLSTANMFRIKQDSAGLREVGNMLSGTASTSPAKVKDVFNAIKSGAFETGQFGKMDPYEVLGLVKLLAEYGFKGSNFATLRTAVLKNKDQKKIKDIIGKISSATGGRTINMSNVAGGPMGFLETIDSIGRVKKDFEGNTLVQELIEKLEIEAFGARGVGKTVAAMQGGGGATIKNYAKLLRQMVDADILNQLASAKLDTTSGRVGLFVSEMSNMLDSLFTPVLKPLMDSITVTLTKDMRKLGQFLDNNPKLTDAIVDTGMLLFGGIRNIALFAGGIFKNVTVLIGKFAPIYQALEGIAKFVDPAGHGLGWLGGKINEAFRGAGGIVGGAVGLGIAPQKGISIFDNPLGLRDFTSEESAFNKKKRSEFMTAGYTAGADFGEVVIPAMIAGPALGALGASASTIGVTSKLDKALGIGSKSNVLGSMAGSISKVSSFSKAHPLVTAGLGGLFGASISNNQMTELDKYILGNSIKAPSVGGPMTVMMNIDINGASMSPESIAEKIQKHFESATFTRMEVPLL
jgi:hypothetical protein